MTGATDVEVERPDDLPDVTGRPVWKVAGKRAVAKFSRDQCTDKAAALTYFSVQSLFPGLIAVISLIDVFGNGKKTTNALIKTLAGILGKSPQDPGLQKVGAFINNVHTTGGGWIALIVGVLGALWSASGYVGGFSRALNSIYDIREGRPVWRLRPRLLLVTAIEVVLIIIVMIALVASGSVAREIGKQIGLGHAAVQVWEIAKWPFVVFIVVFIIGMLYWATPNVAKLKRDIFSWGALVAFIVWVLGSAALVLYVSYTQGSSYQKTYGAFAGAIILLLWLWITNLAMLFGAELDAELIRTRQLRAGLDAEHIVLLPARDESGLIKKERKQKAIIKEAVALRDGERPGSGASADGILEAESARTTSTKRKDEVAMGSYDAAKAKEQVRHDRQDRRGQALSNAKSARKVRDRLERQEARAKKKFAGTLAEVTKERKAREASVTDAERRTQIERTRASYAPEMTPEREHLEAEHRARRAEWDGARQEKRARAAAAPPKPPKEPKEKKPPMPSVLRDQIERDQAYRRKKWRSARGIDA